MKQQLLLISVLIAGMLGLAACQQKVPDNDASAPVAEISNSEVVGTVVETFDANRYTYVLVDTQGSQIWAAGPQTVITVGAEVSFNAGMPMKNFHSKSLNRDFETVYFVDKLITEQSHDASALASPHAGLTQANASQSVSNFSKAEGGYNIAELLENKQKLSNQSVRIRGQVTKFTQNVMGKNWIHIRDNSSQEDLTVTTDGLAQIGEIILVDGKITLDKDYGYGYVYSVLVEDAQVKTE